MSRTITQAVVWFCVATLVAWTVLMALLGGVTVSEVVAPFLRRHAIASFGFGIIVGHWLWPLPGGRK